MIDCRQVAEMLESAYLEGPEPTLPDEVQGHLEHCANCQRDAQELQDAWLLLPASHESLPVGSELEAAVMARIEANETTIPILESSTAPSYNFWKYALAASVFVAVGLSMLLSRQPSNPLEGQTAGSPKHRLEEFAEQMQTLQELERTFGSAQLQFASLRSEDADSKVRGMLVYDLKAGEGHFFGFNFEVDAESVYKLWILDAQQQVVSSGTIQVEAEAQRGTSIVKFPQDRSLMKEIVVTLETDPSATVPSAKVRLRSPVEPQSF